MRPELRGYEQSSFDWDFAQFSLARFVEVLGSRIPDDADLIVPVTAERLIRSYEAKKVSAPNVTRTRSG